MDTPPLRRNTRFQLLWIGGAVSGLGSSMTWLAFPLLILAITGSPALAGVVAACRIGTNILVSLPAGVWVDRLDRRRILVGCEVVRLLAMGGLVAGLVLLDTDLPLAVILVVGVVTGAADAFFGPAHASAIRGVVPADQLPSAYAQEEARSHAAELVGPPVGGALYGVGRAFPFVADLISYVVSLGCILAARVPRRPAVSADTSAEASAHRPRMRTDVAEAMRWVWRRPGIRAALLFSVLINLAVNAELIPVIMMVTERGGGPAVTGIVLGAAGVGGLLGAMLSARIGRLLPPGLLMIGVGLVFGTCLCLMTLPLGTLWPAVMLFVAMVAVPALNVVLKVLVARLVPEDMMGRVVALLGMVSMGLAPLSPLVGGILSEALGGVVSLLVLGGFLVAVAVAFLASPSLRDLRSQDPEADAPAQEDADEPPGDATVASMSGGRDG